MSKTVLIPTETDPFVVDINNIKYSYPAGTEQTVPDDVAAVINNYWATQPHPAKAVDGGVFPYVSNEDNGMILKVKNGAWQVGKDSGFPTVVITAPKGGSVSCNYAYAKLSDILQDNTATPNVLILDEYDNVIQRGCGYGFSGGTIKLYALGASSKSAVVFHIYSCSSSNVWSHDVKDIALTTHVD